MSVARFEIRVPAKWVLAGEHSVLKGAQAVALPHPVFSLYFSFTPEASGGLPGGLQVHPEETSHILNSVFSRIPALRGLSGRVRLESNIPIGAGLGSSAALCVAVTRWVQTLQPGAVAQPLEFARGLEDVFHGRSSGMDVGVILAGEPVAFRMGEAIRPLRVRRIPRFSFHDTGVRAMTRDCVAKVEAYRAGAPAWASEIDRKMSQASVMALEALQAFDSGQTQTALNTLATAMETGQECFEAWSLVPDQAREIIRDLRARGALACKLTGAGGGGMVVALHDS